MSPRAPLGRCEVPGCGEPGIVVAVGPDTPTFIEPETLEQAMADGRPSYVEGLACLAHIPLVRRRLQEQHQPRRMRSREGRP